MANVLGTNGDDLIHRAGDGRTPPDGANDIVGTTGGADTIRPGEGADTIFAEGGDDVAIVDVDTLEAKRIDLGSGADLIELQSPVESLERVRLTFTWSEVGDGSATDSDTLDNQNGGLAVRFNAMELGFPVNAIARSDDEGISYVGTDMKFEVRDLVTGASRGDAFRAVSLGTEVGDAMAVKAAGSNYFAGGQGDDTIAGGAAGDLLAGGTGDDSLMGGTGPDTLLGETGDDFAVLDVAAGGGSEIDLGAGDDRVRVEAPGAAQVRLTFTSAEAGDGSVNDAASFPGQDGGLAVRIQAEGSGGALTGPVSRADDEGLSFTAANGLTFDVRDLVSGAERGDAFRVVTLGTGAADALGAILAGRATYFNGGQGDDTIAGGSANDFLVGGAGADSLLGGDGDDSFIGGSGDDVMFGGAGGDEAEVDFYSAGDDRIDLGAGADVVNVSSGSARLSFITSQVGDGSATDSGGGPPRDGGLAVRLQFEFATGTSVTRIDDEGLTFIGRDNATFDVRDLVTGRNYGAQFKVVALGSAASEQLDAWVPDQATYFNGGLGDDTLAGGSGDDVLIGGAGLDRLIGGLGSDTYFVTDRRDAIVELPGGGSNDAVFSSVGYTLAGANLESLTLIGALDVNGSGNSLANTLTGNIGDNVLSGGAGADTMFGGKGDDIYIVDNAGDRASEGTGGGGVDRVESSISFSIYRAFKNIEDLTLTGAADISGVGNRGDNVLTGNSGDNVLNGHQGADVMIGGLGADSFDFNTTLGAGNVDVITDFDVTVDGDVIRLGDAVFKGLAVGALSADAFVVGAEAADATDRIIFDKPTGMLFFDRDGTGTAFEAVQFATVSANLALTHLDFVVI
jgi:Ca2+-binding RTX toxin-like protein